MLAYVSCRVELYKKRCGAHQQSFHLSFHLSLLLLSSDWHTKSRKQEKVGLLSHLFSLSLIPFLQFGFLLVSLLLGQAKLSIRLNSSSWPPTRFTLVFVAAAENIRRAFFSLRGGSKLRHNRDSQKQKWKSSKTNAKTRPQKLTQSRLLRCALKPRRFVLLGAFRSVLSRRSSSSSKDKKA